MPGHEPGRRWLTRPFDTFYEDPFQSITIIGCYGRSHMEGKWQGGGDLKIQVKKSSRDVSNTVSLLGDNQILTPVLCPMVACGSQESRHQK